MHGASTNGPNMGGRPQTATHKCTPYLLLIKFTSIIYVHTHPLSYLHTCTCTHILLPSAAPPSRPGFNRGVSSPSRDPLSNPTQLSQVTLFPISSLSLYQSKWTIQVHVASKPSIREWSNSRGQGKVFSVNLIDESVSTVGASKAILIHLGCLSIISWSD